MDGIIEKRRKLDFYIKGLPLIVRKNIYKKMEDINPVCVGYLLEKPQGYPHFTRIHYTQENIDRYIGNMKILFDNANNYMMENKRYPVFSNTNDSYKSATEYVDLLKVRPPEELEQEFGCTFQDYIPREYKCSERSEI